MCDLQAEDRAEFLVLAAGRRPRRHRQSCLITNNFITEQLIISFPHTANRIIHNYLEYWFSGQQQVEGEEDNGPGQAAVGLYN